MQSWAALSGLSSVLAAAVLLCFPPGRFAFYPACPFHAVTGLLCPGCGATRALASLLRGEVAEAIRLNELFVLVVLPAGVLYLLLAHRCGRWLRIPGWVLAALVVLTAGFTVVRNL